MTAFDTSILRTRVRAPSGPMFGRMVRGVLGIRLEEVTLARRGFLPTTSAKRERLETIGCAFLDGYHAGLEHGGGAGLESALGSAHRELQGFAFEGAAMALFLMDSILPWRRNRWDRFLSRSARPHAYMWHVGAGWVFARLGRNVQRGLERFDPILRWLVVDGYGFHHAYFQPRECIDRQDVPRSLSGYTRRAFDQGLGRGLWFALGADVDRIAGSIERFDAARRPDLWSGIGLACACAGGVDQDEAECLRERGSDFRTHIAQGAAFAAKVRERVGNPAPHTEMACRVLAGCSAAEAAAVTDRLLEDLPTGGAEPAYETWRLRIQEHFAKHPRA